MAKFYYGGQAVIEGVMMRGRKSVAAAIRRPDGSIYLYEEALNPRLYRIVFFACHSYGACSYCGRYWSWGRA
jgi:uncharacterized protein YqhQ